MSGIWLADQQVCTPKHTPGPSGYIAWFEWAEKMAETHRPTRCPDCRLWAIWVPRQPREGVQASPST
jgi:hypothetical protein